MARVSDYLAPYNIRCADNIIAPVLTATVQGTVGNSILRYAASYTTIVGETDLSVPVEVDNGPAALNGFNKVLLSVPTPPTRALAVRFWKDEWNYQTTTQRVNSQSYSVGDSMVVSANSSVQYVCTTAGVSNASDPGNWPTAPGATQQDGTMVWTVQSNIIHNWQLLGTVSPGVAQMYDIGQATTVATAPATNTSGREGVLGIGCKPGTLVQRMTWEDLQGILMTAIQDLGDTLMKNGDVQYGCGATIASGTTWNLASGTIYFLGRILPVSAGQVTLKGTGQEVVGLTVEPIYSTPDMDLVQRASLDEGVNPLYGSTGPDWLYFSFTWGVDQPGQIPIHSFTDNVLDQVSLPLSTTALDRQLARRTFDVSGNFVSNPFQFNVQAHAGDDTQLDLAVGAGKAYPNGYEVQTTGTRLLPFKKARDVKTVTDSGTDAFDIRGGVVITSNHEPFNVDGQVMTFRFSPNGNYHTVTLSGTAATAAQLATQIETQVNSYPSDPTIPLVKCTASGGVLEIEAAISSTSQKEMAGKSLELVSVANSAYAALGLQVGVSYPSGQRLYPINNLYVKDVTNMSYKAFQVDQVTHNSTTNIDQLSKAGVLNILGASNTLANCWDGKWDYQLGVDFTRQGDTISFAGLGGAKPGSGSVYFVAYQFQAQAIKGTRIKVRVTDAQITKGAVGTQDNLVVTNATSITSVATGQAVAGVTGSIKDATAILRVNTSPGQSTDQFAGAYQLLKNSTAYSHSVSQVDWSPSGTSLTAQPTSNLPYYVTYEAWYHAVDGDYVSADSYDIYEDIESVGSQNLRDVIDFRETTLGMASFANATKTLPVQGENPVFNFDFYLSRIDKLTLDQNGIFSLITGAPALVPPIPADQTGLLSLAILTINPYTYSLTDVSITSMQPMRITQAGIQDLANRIARLEYWGTVNDLENQVASTPAATANPQGVFSDALTGFSRMSLQFNKNGIMHTAALDQASRSMLLPVSQDQITISVDEQASSHVRYSGNLLVLDFEEYPMVTQDKASSTINVNPDDIFNFNNATMALSPATQAFLDTTQAPVLNADFDNGLTPYVQALIEATPSLKAQYESTQWGAWRVATPQDVANARAQGQVYSGGHTQEVAASLMGLNWWQVGGNATFARSGTQTTLVPTGVTQDLGSRVVDMTMVPMMSTTNQDGTPFQIHVSCTGLMPNAEFACTIAGIAVSFLYDTSVSSPKGSAGSSTYQGLSTVKADMFGNLTGVFNMPQGVQAGSQAVKVFVASNPAASSAQAQFSSFGFADTTQQTTVGFQTLQDRVGPVGGVVEAVTSWGDPLAQSFLVQNSMQYISSIKLYFASKSATMPITLDIRQMSNGYPTRTVLATTTVQASDVQVSSDASAPTVFSFENVLGYNPDEYCFVLMTNSDEYNVYKVNVGDTTLSGEFVPVRPYDGVLFHSPNNSTWEMVDQSVLKFEIDVANFQNNCQIFWDNLTGVQASLLVMKVQEFIAPSTNAIWSYSLDNGLTWTPFNPSYDNDLGEIITQIKLRVDVTSLGGSYNLISKYAGIVLLYHAATADSIWNDSYFTDNLNYPNKIHATLDLDTDGVGSGSGGPRTIIPFYSIDDGQYWVELGEVANDNPPYTNIGNFRTYTFETPDVQTVEGFAADSGTTPVTLTIPNHGFKENAVVLVSGVNSVANGTWRLKGVTQNTVGLVDPNTGANATGAGTYTSGGTMGLAAFTQMRPRVFFSTSNRALTPRLMNVGFVCSKV